MFAPPHLSQWQVTPLGCQPTECQDPLLQVCPPGTAVSLTGAKECPESGPGEGSAWKDCCSCAVARRKPYAQRGNALLLLPALVPAGTFAAAAGQAAPSVCPEGTANPYFAISSADACVPCVAGTFAKAGWDACDPCPAGQFQDKQGQASCKVGVGVVGRREIICSMRLQPWRQASTPAPAPQACPAGSACPLGSATPRQCAAGFFSLESQGACTLCPQGTTSLAGSATCRLSCPVASPCAAAKMAAAAKATTICPAGSFALTNSRTKAVTCNTCPRSVSVGLRYSVLYSMPSPGQTDPAPLHGQPASPCSFVNCADILSDGGAANLHPLRRGAPHRRPDGPGGLLL